MEANGVTFQPGQAAAHIVPSGGAKGHWAPGARARQLLEDYDVDINDHNNGIPVHAARGRLLPQPPRRQPR
ncbi:AHH domain-containing protein [Streptomyces aureus]|uniref:AHH domain-containing protein n=1 Tax=Streptomyces aureus TaxID=193461 RepID=UPI003622D7A6